MTDGAGGPPSPAELDRRFTYHKPDPTKTRTPGGLNQHERYDWIRATAAEFAQGIVDLTPPSREQSLALTKLEEAVMWANAAIARRD